MTAPELQEGSLDDARVALHAAVSALDLALAQAEHLNDASPQLMADQDFWEFSGAHGGMTTLLGDLIELLGEREA